MAKFRSKNRPLRVFKPSQRTVATGQHLLSVDSLADDGRGIAHVSNKTVFVTGALAGEQVKARYISSHKNYDEAVAVAIVEAAEQRVMPVCEYVGRCGGCDLQHLNYDAQLAHKQQRLSLLFSAWLENDNTLAAQAITGSPLLYRHRARFAVDAGKHRCDIGFRQARSHKVVDITHCSIVYQGINAALPGVRRLIASLKNRSVVNEVAITEDSDGKHGVAIFSSKPLCASDIAAVNHFANDQHCIVEIRDSSSLAQHESAHDNTSTLSYRLDAYGLTIPFAVDDFTQVNPGVNNQLIALAIKWLALSGDDVVADFFCGIGNFSLPIAQSVSRVIGYELVAPMVAKAIANAAVNEIENCQFKVSDLMADKVPSDAVFNKALLDPPRAGAEQLCRHLATTQLERIVYISCNPATLARDTQILTNGNFQLAELVLADMFPQTAHSEVVALFTRNHS